MATIDTARNQIIHYLEGVKSEIIDLAKGYKPYAMVASGKTLLSLQVIPSNTGAKLVAADHIIYLETGRGPTSPIGPYQLDAEGKTLEQHIEQWIKDKGLEDKLNAYAVTKKIHKEGTALYRAGGKSGILSIPLNGAGLGDLYANIATLYRQKVSSEIYEPINELQTL